MSQERFWKELYQLKVHSNYVEAHIHEAEKIDRVIKIFLAMTSSASIGAWVVWKDYSLVWAFIIALSQVVSVVSPHLPFNGRLKPYTSMLHELEELFIHADAKWTEIEAGKLTEDEIEKARTNIRLLKHKILKKNLSMSVIPENDDKLNKAEASALSYFNNFYTHKEKL